MKVKKMMTVILSMIMAMACFCTGTSAATLESQTVSISYGSPTNSNNTPIQRYIKNGKVYLEVDFPSEAMNLYFKNYTVFDEGYFYIYGGLEMSYFTYEGIEYSFFTKCNFTFCIAPRKSPQWSFDVYVEDAIYSMTDCTFDLSSNGKFEFSVPLSSDLGQLVAKETNFALGASVYKYSENKSVDESTTYFLGDSLRYDEYYLESPLESS